MNEKFFNGLSTCIFTDDGIYYEWPGQEKKFYPYGSIFSIKMNFIGIKITEKEKDKDGKYKNSIFNFDIKDKGRLKEVIVFAEKKIKDAPTEKAIDGVEVEKISLDTKYVNNTVGKKVGVKWRNIGLLILLFSVLLVLLDCFVLSTAILAIAGIFGSLIGLFMFASNLNFSGFVLREKKKSNTKEIVKGAVVGGIVAGEVGAVIGATIAKNNLDKNNEKK